MPYLPLLLIIVLLLITGALNAQLREFSISDMPRPEVAVVQANNQFPDDALVLVYSAIEALEFRSSLGAIDKQTYNASASRYELLVKPVKQMLFAAKAGFIEAKVAILNPNPKDVYYYKVEEKKDALPVQSEPGMLQITTTPPGADIFLNGIQIIDKTPFKGAATAGTTSIKLRKKKYIEFDTTITIGSQKSALVAHTFQSSYLYYSINSNPSGATVTIDGAVLGKTPLSKEIELSDVSKQGVKKLLIQLDEYEDIEEPIHYLPSNKPLELNYELKKKKGAFLITSVPEGASVYIDGAFKGLTPYVGSKEFGNYEVKVELDGYIPSEQKQLLLSRTAITQLAFTLRPLPRPNEETELSFESIAEVKIGNQIWMVSNLNTSRFRNGDLIPEAKTADEWNQAGLDNQPAWCYYDNDPINGEKYGRLYNWYTVVDPRGLCPAGWHVPSDSEWTVLVDYLGENAGGKMKSNNTVNKQVIMPYLPPSPPKYKVKQKDLYDYAATVAEFGDSSYTVDMAEEDFPELAGNEALLELYDIYANTLNSGDYSTIDEVNAKFPEFEFLIDDGWPFPNLSATNESGFSGLPGGRRGDWIFDFIGRGFDGFWWSSTENFTYNAWNRKMWFNGGEVIHNLDRKETGCSVRCLKD